MLLDVLTHCLLDKERGLAYLECSLSSALVDCWLKTIAAEAAWVVSHAVSGEAEAVAEVVLFIEWLDGMAVELKGIDGPNGKGMAAQFKAAQTQLRNLVDNSNSSRNVNSMKDKTQQDVHNSILQAASQKAPLLTQLLSTTSRNPSPFQADITAHLAASAARSNQKDAFNALCTYFDKLNNSRATAKELSTANMAFWAAFCQLRVTVCKMMLINTQQASKDEWRPQLDSVLAAYAAAFRDEQQLLGEDSSWANVAAGVVEPTGTGKTGIIDLAPFAALGRTAPSDCSRKVLVVTPNLVIRHQLLNSFSTQAGQSCLRDILRVTADPELLPKAFDLSTFVLMASTPTAPPSEDAKSAVEGTSRTSNNTAFVVAASTVALPEVDEDPGAQGVEDVLLGGDSNRASNNNAAYVVAAAAVTLPEVDEDSDAGCCEDMNAMDPMDEDMIADMLNNATDVVNGITTSNGGGSTQHLPTAAATTTTVQAGPVRTALQRLASADVVVANIHQLPLKKLEVLFPRDYFGLVIVDEGHHAAARTWSTVLDYFAPASKVLLTATPFRGDRAKLPMLVITGQTDDLKISQRIKQGLCSNVAYAPVPVSSVQIIEAGSDIVETYSGQEELHVLGERRDIQEVARKDLSVREATMRYSMALMQALRAASNQRHTIIAQAQDIADAEQLCQQWTELIDRQYAGQYTVGYTHSKLKPDKQAEMKALTKAGKLDVCIHVGQLGEGFDAPALSIVAVFKMFRSVRPFMQLLGRAARRVLEIPASHPCNVAYLVAHPLLGYHKHWQVYCEERQDMPRELNGIGKPSNVRIVSHQAGSFSPAALPGPGTEAFYIVPPSHITAETPTHPHTSHTAADSSAVVTPDPAPLLKLPQATPATTVGPAPATTGRPAPATVVAAARPVETQITEVVAAGAGGGPRSAAQQNLQMLSSNAAGSLSLTQLRSIIGDHPYLSHIQTAVKGRTVAAVHADVAEALRTVLEGGGSLGLVQLAQLRQSISGSGVRMKELGALKDKLHPWLSHITTSGAGRTVDVVRRDMLAAIGNLIDLQTEA